nr:MAG TPA: hypothetical protein [Caudoviricetes sp.]
MQRSKAAKPSAKIVKNSGFKEISHGKYCVYD